MFGHVCSAFPRSSPWQQHLWRLNRTPHAAAARHPSGGKGWNELCFFPFFSLGVVLVGMALSHCGAGGVGREEEEGRPALAEPHFSQALTCRAGHWLEFPMGGVGCYLMKLDTANCAKESHQADIQHQLKEGKDHVFPRQPGDRPCPKSTRHGAWLAHSCTPSMCWSPPEPVLLGAPALAEAGTGQFEWISHQKCCSESLLPSKHLAPVMHPELHKVNPTGAILTGYKATPHKATSMELVGNIS